MICSRPASLISIIIMCLVLITCSSHSKPDAGTRNNEHSLAPDNMPLNARLDVLEGDTIENAIYIDDFGETVVGTTEGYTDDYDVACPYEGSTSPDIVYVVSPSHCWYDWSIDLCASDYDTKVYVYENYMSPETLVGCNDDYSDCINLYRSRLNIYFASEYSNYYIVVDGYGGEYGEFQMTIEGHVYMLSECLECPEGGIAEGEPNSPPSEYVDYYNGGCNTDPDNPPLQLVEGDEIGEYLVCGSLFLNGEPPEQALDKDWYQYYAGDAGYVSLSVRASQAVKLSIMPLDCSDMVPIQYTYTSPYSVETIEYALAPGSEGRVQVFTRYPDVYGSKYSIWFSGLHSGAITPTKSISWGKMKMQFK